MHGSHNSAYYNPFRPEIPSSCPARLINWSLIIFWQISSPLSLTLHSCTNNILIIKSHEKLFPLIFNLFLFYCQPLNAVSSEKPFGVMIHELFLSYFFLPSFLLFLSAYEIKFLTLRDKTIHRSERWSSITLTWCLCWHWPWSRVSWARVTCRGRGLWSPGTGRAGQPPSVTRWSRQSGERGERIIGIPHLIMAPH